MECALQFHWRHLSSNYPDHITWQIYSANKYSQHTIFILKSYTRARIIKAEDNEVWLYVSTISANETVRHNYSTFVNNYTNLVVVFYLQLLIFTLDILQNLLRLLSGNGMIIGDRPTTLI
jgi:hypothetical protein